MDEVKNRGGYIHTSLFNASDKPQNAQASCLHEARELFERLESSVMRQLLACVRQLHLDVGYALL